MIWVVAAVLIFVALGFGVLSPYFTESHKMHERLSRLSPRKRRRVARRAPSYSPLDGEDVSPGSHGGAPGGLAAGGAFLAGGGGGGGGGDCGTDGSAANCN